MSADGLWRKRRPEASNSLPLPLLSVFAGDRPASDDAQGGEVWRTRKNTSLPLVRQSGQPERREALALERPKRLSVTISPGLDARPAVSGFGTALDSPDAFETSGPERVGAAAQLNPPASRGSSSSSSPDSVTGRKSPGLEPIWEGTGEPKSPEVAPVVHLSEEGPQPLPLSAPASVAASTGPKGGRPGALNTVGRVNSMSSSFGGREGIASRRASTSAKDPTLPASVKEDVAIAEEAAVATEVVTDEGLFGWVLTAIRVLVGTGRQALLSPMTLLRNRNNRLRTLNDVNFFLAVVGVAAFIVETEVARRGYRERYAALAHFCEAMGLLQTVSTAFLLFFVWRMYDTRLRIMQMNPILTRVNLFTSGLWKRCALEMAVCVVHVPPFVDFEIGVADIDDARNPDGMSFYNIHIIGLLMFLRLYLVTRVLRDHSRMYGTCARFVSSLNKISIDFPFVLKTMFVKQPLRTMTVIICTNLLVSSYCLHIAEVAVQPDLPYGDSLWLLFIASATVGFGDVVPHTYIGRTIVAVSVTLSTVTTALVVAIVNQQLRMSDDEWRMYHILEAANARRVMRANAARCIQLFWRRRRRGLEHYAALQRMRESRRRLITVEREVAVGPALVELQCQLQAVMRILDPSESEAEGEEEAAAAEGGEAAAGAHPHRPMMRSITIVRRKTMAKREKPKAAHDVDEGGDEPGSGRATPKESEEGRARPEPAPAAPTPPPAPPPAAPPRPAIAVEAAPGHRSVSKKSFSSSLLPSPVALRVHPSPWEAPEAPGALRPARSLPSPRPASLGVLPTAATPSPGPSPGGRSRGRRPSNAGIAPLPPSPAHDLLKAIDAAEPVYSIPHRRLSALAASSEAAAAAAGADAQRRSEGGVWTSRRAGPAAHVRLEELAARGPTAAAPLETWGRASVTRALGASALRRQAEATGALAGRVEAIEGKIDALAALLRNLAPAAAASRSDTPS